MNFDLGNLLQVLPCSKVNFYIIYLIPRFSQRIGSANCRTTLIGKKFWVIEEEGGCTSGIRAEMIPLQPIDAAHGEAGSPATAHGDQQWSRYPSAAHVGPHTGGCLK